MRKHILEDLPLALIMHKLSRYALLKIFFCDIFSFFMPTVDYYNIITMITGCF